MIMLSLSTSGPLPSAAVFSCGSLVYEAMGQGGKTHSETLMPLVEEALEAAGVAPSQVDKFAVDVGPGSFTGVRIGVCAANAMAMAQGKPVAGVSSLRSLVQGLEGSVCALLDCRNGNGYALLMRDGEVVLPESAVTISHILERAPAGTLFVGDGSVLHREAILAVVSSPRFCLKNDVTAQAVGLCALALPGGREAMPQYLRPSQAERLYQEKQP